LLLVHRHHRVVGPDNHIPPHIPGELNVIHIPAGNDSDDLVEVNRNCVQGLHNRVFRDLGRITAIVLSCRHVAVVKLDLI
jgi:hypothetical protein